MACTAACALRKRVAATTCIALVIFCVFRIESIRRTMSLNAGNYFFFFSAGLSDSGAGGSDLPVGSGVSW